MLTACGKEPSVEVLKHEKISGYTIAVCKFPDKTIRLAMKTKEGYEPFFTIYEASVKDAPIEEIKIQTGQGALEHDYIRVMFRMEPFTQSEFEFEYIIPPNITHYSGGLLDIRFKDLVFESFSCSEIKQY